MRLSKRKQIRIIGKGYISIFLCIVVITSAVTTATTLQVRNGETIGFQTHRECLSYSFSFTQPTISLKTESDSLYSKIQMSGCMNLGKQAGDPTIPVKFIQLLLPASTTVGSVEVTGSTVEFNLEGIDLTQQPIYPYQNEVPVNSDVPGEFLLNDELYASNQLYPAKNHGEYHIGYSRGYAILDMALFPMQYIPAAGEAFYYPEMTVTIHLKEQSGSHPLFRNNPNDKKWVQSLVSNPEMTATYLGAPPFEYPGGLCDPTDQYDYVIITTTQNGLNYWDIGGTLTYNWNSLMDKHNGEGLQCTLVTKQDIFACPDYYNSTALFNDTQARIREFCRDAYQDWGTEYVLIAGDSDTMPARQLYYSYEGNVDSDLYWSNLDKNFNADMDTRWGEEGDLGFDVYSELYIGRIVCDEPQDVSNWLTKSFYYADSTDYDYLDNAAFYGGDLGWNCQGDDFIDYSAIKTTTNWLGPIPGAHGAYPSWLGLQYGFETWNQVNPGNMYNLSVKWTAEPPNPGWQGGSESAAITGLRTAINSDKVTLLSGVAHANHQMSLDVYDTVWATQYTNTKPFFIHDWGCHCGDFDAGDGILEVMLFNSDTKLAFGCVYNTCYGWGSFDDTNSSSTLQQKSFWDYFFDTENNSQDFGNWQLGKGQAFSKDLMAPTLNWTYASAPGSWRGVIEGCLLFGDPAQTIKTPSPSDAPTKPTKPVGQMLGIWNVEYPYTSSSTDPNGDQIYYLFDWADGSNSGWLGPYSSGQTVTASHTWTVLGVYEIKVRARDIWGASSDWSDPLEVTITDNTPPEIPEITGTTEGKPGNEYLYSLLTTDMQDQEVYYFVDWGDNTTSGWLGPYVSGTQIHVTHSWAEKGTYTVKAKAKDSMDMESDWGSLTVVMPMSYRFSLQVFLQQLLEMFPRMFPLLRNLMGY
ncbi:MAG: hypothetical protein BV458_03065 [Thermoplasmata archaeon M9B2D]|nr:MAG: hypothetical protein BV458_03065 [Thermoplasmata archaeon M9B2D]